MSAIIETVILEQEADGNVEGVKSVAGPRRVDLSHGAGYAFDGNQVVAHFERDENGQDNWCLETIDPDIWFLIGDDFNVYRHQRVDGQWTIRAIEEFESVFDALKPLDEAACDCAINGHAWSPTQGDSSDPASYVWQWCLACGSERVWFSETGDLLTWPDDHKIAARTEGGLPTLHGPIVGGTR